ncbi:uncharacterized protein LOC134524462 [Chroicocephalus ridibundus]|uniref:uncharacterized protein LOC134524462 n=1 Tax=Chroicocephalus ridibundus TaxID=1192867 RepID=UPI002FDEE247
MAETTEGIGISINCSHPNIKPYDSIHWYRQLPGRGPAFLLSTLKDSKDLRDPPGRLWVSADRRSSALWLARPRRGDAAVYYCALGDTGRGAGAAAGQEPARAGPGVCVGAEGTVPDGTARGRCRSARRGRLAPTSPSPRAASPARPAPAPAAATPHSQRDAHRNPPPHCRRRGGRNGARSAGRVRRGPTRSDGSRRPRWRPAGSSAFLRRTGRPAAQTLLPTCGIITKFAKNTKIQHCSHIKESHKIKRLLR